MVDEHLMPLAIAVLVSFLLLNGCTQEGDGKAAESPDGQQAAMPAPSREEAIPLDAVKITPETDAYAPLMHSGEYEAPVPVAGRVNTAGAEDSPFVLPDGNTLYFFFTPDVRVPAEKQLLDKVTGIWVSRKEADGSWGEPERVLLQDPGKLALDGCEFVQGNRMWFCSAREGFDGMNWFTAELVDGKWAGWQKDDEFKPEYEVGELHISSDGSELYFHSARAGGKGGYDVWMSKKAGGEWQEPVNLEAINSAENDGWPYLSQDGKELWFLRTYMGSPAVYRSKRIDGAWQEPELMVSQFAGEPTLDAEGNLYFVHHFYKDGKMLEADIYFAKKKK
ncbi:WD40-like Beta Propeller Repeat protein [Candidatus Burarchaeum australiense]|nr:WD40-like Beta Propeller Repeat protein [Candidatus Burarchaeum australiense]